MNTVSTKRPYELKERAKRQEETRQRIIEATVALHEEVGPARTTVTEIAKRAGVQRLTVYKHFPGEAELFTGCSIHYITDHPFPDPTEALAIEDPEGRVRATLALLYPWYRETRQMTQNIARDRLLIPAIDERAAELVDGPLGFIAAELAKGFRARGARTDRIAAMLAVATDFWTWRRLDDQGLGDEAAADLMASAVAGA